MKRYETYHTKDLTEMHLYRFIQKEFLFQFLEKKAIWFSRADGFGDKMECVMLTDLLVEKPDFAELEARKKKFLISCWHLADNESLALWDAYARSKEQRRVAAIRFKRRDLAMLFYHGIPMNEHQFDWRTRWIQGSVQYKDLTAMRRARDVEKAAVKYTVFRKERAFKYESEYRFVVQLPGPFAKDGFLFRLPEPLAVKFDVLVNPMLEADEYNGLRQEIEARGYGSHLQVSHLNRWLHPELWSLSNR